MLRVGLTGGIACGKSHVLRRLAARGCRTLDLDAVAREVTAPGTPALAEIERDFGPGVLDARGGLDRARLGALVFADAAARERLNAIVHPRVREAEALWAASLSAHAGAVLVTDGALLVESGVHLRFDRLVVVHCEPGLQLVRLRERDGLDERAACARVEAQLSSAVRRGFAHFELDTSGSPEDTDAAADALGESLAALAAAEPARGKGPLERLVGGLAHGPQDGPRGLTPAVLLEEGARASGLELERLARRLLPKAPGPWYRAGEAAPAAEPAARLAVAIAAWAQRVRGSDPDFLAAAAGSVARLTHADAGERADACLVALVAQERATAGAAAGELRSLAARGLPLAARFGGGQPTGRLEAVWSALEQAPDDPERAAAWCARLGGDAATAKALAGLGGPVSGPEAARWRHALDQVAERVPRPA